MGSVIVAEAWTALEATRGGKGITRQRIAPQAPIDIHLAVEHPGGTRMVLFGIPHADLAKAFDIPQATGISIRAVPAAAETGWGYAEVRLADGRYSELFVSLADDLVGEVMAAESPDMAINRLSDRLRRWEAFLKVVDPSGLSQERRAGLFGELHVLREHLIPLDPAAAVSAWVGPMGAHQDLQAPGWAVEVKTSRTKVPISVRISGERQLDDIGLEFLGLAHIGLEQRRHSGETLPEMVASVRMMLSGTPAAERFEASLFAAGYLADHEPRYADDGYLIRFDELFAVRDSFPRLTERDLPRGVGEVAYSIEIAALGGFRIDWTSLPTFRGYETDDGGH